MKVKRTRGMRDIPTIQGLSRRAVPNTRPQAATEMARLEHEKARLERELRIWIHSQKRTEDRLRRVEERLARVRKVLGPLAAEGPAERSRIRRLPTGEADRGEGEAQSWQEIPLEY